MIRYSILFSLFLMLGFVSSCADKSADSKRREVAINDNNYRTDKNGALLIDDRDLDRSPQQIATNFQNKQEIPKTGGDSSQISTMIDGFGNKIEKRIFYNHPLLRQILLRTSSDGRKSVFVYGQNGDVNPLPDEMQEKAMIASAAELAGAAGILTGRDENDLPFFMQMHKQKSAETLLPDYQQQFSTPTISEPLQTEIQTPETAPEIQPVFEQKPKIAEQKYGLEKNYQAEINEILLQSNKRRTAKTEGTLTRNIKSVTTEKLDK